MTIRDAREHLQLALGHATEAMSMMHMDPMRAADIERRNWPDELACHQVRGYLQAGLTAIDSPGNLEKLHVRDVANTIEEALTFAKYSAMHAGGDAEDDLRHCILELRIALAGIYRNLENMAA